MRPCIAVFLLVFLLCGVSSPHAGVIRNADAREYSYTIHWEDLSAPETFDIAAGETQQFEDKKATVELKGKKDNIYVQPGETIMILEGVMRRVPSEEDKSD